MSNVKITNRILIIFTLLIAFLSIVIGTLVTPSEDLFIKGQPISTLNDNWILSYDQTKKEISLPNKNPEISPNQVYTITKQLSDSFPEDTYLRFRLSMQYMTVYLDQQVIYEYTPITYEGFHPPEASVWKIIHLQHADGKTLKVDFFSPVEAFAGTINEINYGVRGALVFDILSVNYLGMIIAFSLFLIGTIMMIGAFTIKFHKDLRLFILSLFSFAMGTWLMSEMALLQFFTNNRFIIGGISYILLPLMPILFTEYLKYVILNRYKKIIMAHNIIYLIMLIVNLSLQGLGLVYFIDSIVVVDAMLLVSAIMILILLTKEYKTYKNQNAKKMLQYMMILVVMVVVEVILFFSRNYLVTSAYSRIGFMIFFILLAVDAMKQLNKLINLEKERQFYEEMAYTDILTKAKNRAAYERDLETFEKENSITSIALILMDLNHLKQINDQYGHKEGDRAIKLCLSAIKESFHDIGTYYRIGGDEFTCIIINPDENLYKKRTQALRDKIQEVAKTVAYPLEMAIGSGRYFFNNDNDFSSYDAFFHYVDTKMYEDKKRLKK